MDIVVTRKACCAQADQVGPLTLVVELKETSTIPDLAMAIGEARFLQFTSTHSEMNVLCGGNSLFCIPSYSEYLGSSVTYFVDKQDLVVSHLQSPRIECLWPNSKPTTSTRDI